MLVAVDARPAYRWHVRSWGGPTVPDAADRSTLMTLCGTGRKRDAECHKFVATRIGDHEGIEAML